MPTHPHTAARDAFLKEPEKDVALARKCDVSDTYMMDGICARASDSVAHATSPSEVDILVNEWKPLTKGMVREKILNLFDD
jgi:hypothetical protein